MKTLETIRDFLDYDPETGLFRWIVSPNSRAQKGSIAGVCYNRGEVGIRFGGRRYLAHRLAWWFQYGEMPRGIDHKDGNPSNNAIENLRAATQAQNLANKRRHSKCEAYKGVRRRRGGRYEAAICLNYQQIYLGTHLTAEDAARAYDAAARQCFGEFARLNFPGDA